MRLKSYFAGTVESAICLARQEMGGDAMLVNSRRTLPEARHLGAYEVVFAAAQDPVHQALQAKIEEPANPAAQTLVSELAEMRRQLSKMSSIVSRSAVRGGRRSTTAANPALDSLDQALAANDVDGDLAC